MKSTWIRLAVVAVCLSLWIGAASVTQPDNGTDLTTTASAASTTCFAGTDLTTTASVASTACSTDDTTATVNINVTFASTASAAPVSVLISTDGGATFTPVGTISDQSQTGARPGNGPGPYRDAHGQYDNAVRSLCCATG